MCGDGEENLEHVWKCKVAERQMEGEWREEVEKLGLRREGNEYREAIINLLKGNPVESICRYSRKFEEIARSMAEEGKG